MTPPRPSKAPKTSYKATNAKGQHKLPDCSEKPPQGK